MMLQRLATGSTGVEQARYRRSSTRGSEALARALVIVHFIIELVVFRPECRVFEPKVPKT